MSQNQGAILDTRRAAPAAAAPSRSTDRADLPKATLWLNIGYTVTVKDEATGEETTQFVSLPVGVPLDTMAQARVTGSPEFSRLQQARNALLQKLIDGGSSIAPGEFRTLSLDVQMRRVNDDRAGDPADNALIVTDFDIFAPAE
jgi:hypothetical protein